LTHRYESIRFPCRRTLVAVLAGGGLDLTMNRRLAIQGDYLRTQLPNAAGNQQNLVRVSAGIVLRIR
jgi:hypothetical protein